MDTQRTPSYKSMRFHLASGAVLFEFSPEKLKDYVYELQTHLNLTSPLNDASFSTVISALLSVSSMGLDDLKYGAAFGTDLRAILDCQVKDEQRFWMLGKVWHELVNRPEHAPLHKEVENLVEVDLKAANLPWEPKHDLRDKSIAMVRHLTQLGITREPRSEDKEFTIHLYKRCRGQAGKIEVLWLYFSYTISFGSFLAILRDRTVSQTTKGGLTLQEGPWKYKMEKAKKAEGDWYDLTDEDLFKDMLRKLELGEGAASMIHSVEDAIERQYQETEMIELERRENEEVLDANGKPFFDKSSYLEYLATQPL